MPTGFDARMTAELDALVVSQVSKHSVTAACPVCTGSFQTILFKKGRQQRSFCSNACRQVAYRKSPAHRAVLDGLRNQRLNRRNSYFQRKNAFKSIGLDVYSGPEATGVPSIEMLELRKFSRERDSLTPFSHKEYQEKNASNT